MNIVNLTKASFDCSEHSKPGDILEETGLGPTRRRKVEVQVMGKSHMGTGHHSNFPTTAKGQGGMPNLIDGYILQWNSLLVLK